MYLDECTEQPVFCQIFAFIVTYILYKTCECKIANTESVGSLFDQEEHSYFCILLCILFMHFFSSFK